MKGNVTLLRYILLYVVIVPNKEVESIPVTFFEYVRNLYQHFNKVQNRYVDVSGDEIQREGEYDFIVIGAGTAGSVVANRLSEEEGWKVLLLEAGSYDSFITDIPIMTAVTQLTDFNWGYSTEPQEKACWAMKEKRCNWPRGKVLGGSSSINYMIYTRGNKLDYDSWAQLGNHGWSYEEVLPYFLKSENIQIPEFMSSKYHSSGGYLNVETVSFRTPLAEAFIDGADELGYKIGDYNGEDQHKFSFIQATLRKGSRCSSAKAFLRPIQKRTNFHMSVNSRVTKIDIHPGTKQVSGVEFMKDGIAYRVNVRKEVICSAGALNSPQLLMLSGIGPKDHLKELGINVVQDLKVGNNLQDHVSFLGLTFLVNATVGLNTDRLLSLPTISEYLLNRKGPWTVPGGVEAIGFIRTKYAEDDRPDVELMFFPVGLNNDLGDVNKRNLGMLPDFYKKVYGPIENLNAFSIFPFVLRPKSYGFLKLRNKNPFASPLFYANYSTDRRDIDTLIEGIKASLLLAETLPLKTYGAKLHNIPVPGCEDLTFGSDEYWGCAIKHISSTVHHQMGTCKMGTDQDAVVDPMLRVYGVKGLRVADTSIIPTMPTAHPAAVAYMIGEKASDIIKEFWK